MSGQYEIHLQTIGCGGAELIDHLVAGFCWCSVLITQVPQKVCDCYQLVLREGFISQCGPYRL
jgi:hypothetical protein